MKKIISLLLVMLMIASLAACGSKFEWTREGYFSDDDSNLLFIQKSEDTSKPGWYVGGMFDDGMFGDVIKVKGNALKGDIAGDLADVDSYEVTITEEGEDGVKLETKNGKVMHFKPYEMPIATIIINITTKGEGEINAVKEGEEFHFEDIPQHVSYIGLASPETYTIGARPEEGYKFKRWLKNGEEFTTEPIFTLELTESADFVAVFGIKGTDETHVDLDNVKTLGQVLGLPDYGSACYPDYGKYIYVFEQGDVYYRAIANISADAASKVMDLDAFDEKHDEKLREIINSLTVEKIENLNDTMLTQDQINALIGKKCEELLNNGWTNSGWNLDQKRLHMSYKAFDYTLYFEGDIKDADNFTEEDIKPLIVKSIEVYGFGEGTYYEQ